VHIDESPGLSDVLSGDAKRLLLCRCARAVRDRRRRPRQRRPVEATAAMVSTPEQGPRLDRLVGDGV